MIRKIVFLLTISLAVGFYSCSSDGDVEPVDGAKVPAEPTVRPTDVDFPTFSDMVTTSISGRIIDTDGQPIENAKIICLSCEGDPSVSSDEVGSFSFQALENEGQQALLSVSFPGKFDGYRRLALLEDKQNYTSIQLRDKNMEGVISTIDGGTVSSASGAKVTLSEDGILDAEGNVYNGEYNVYMSWIDPTSPTLNESMMGDLSAIDEDNNLMGLSTFGMLQVELEAEDGTALNLSGGATAELSFPVPDALRNIAPDMIPLWSYDETHGYWVEEGQAELVGDNYVGSVTHFSTWNVDTKFDPINLCGEVQLMSNEKTLGLPYYEIRLSGSSFNSVGGWLCEDGSFTFLNIPSGEKLTLEIINYCGEVVETIQLGPYDEDTKLTDPIILSNTGDLTDVLIEGNALACDGSVLDNGNIQVVMNDRILNFPLDNQGEFIFAVTLCSGTSATMSILNKDDFSISSSIIISELNNNYDLIDIVVCEENEEYFLVEWEDGFDMGSSLVLNPQDLWYERDQNDYLFNVIFPVDTIANCWDTNGNGINDPAEDTNGDGIFNQDDCVMNGQGPTVFAFTQELLLDQIIRGVEGDGLVFEGLPGTNIPGSYEFLFTEIGPLDASGNPSVIAGSIKGSLEQLGSPINFTSSFRLKPL